MKFDDVLSSLRANWWVIPLSAVVGVSLAFLITILTPRMYASNTTFYISSQSSASDNVTTAYQGGLLSEQRVRSYAQLISSERVLSDVRQLSEDSRSPDELRSLISVTTQPDTVLLDVEVTDSSPQGARRVADAVGQSFSRLVADLERPSQPGAPSPVVARIVQPATFDPVAVSPVLKSNLALGGAVGIVVGLGWAVVRRFIDRRVRDEQSAKDATGLPSIGFIYDDKRLETDGLLAAISDLGSSRADALRQIRLNLRFLEHAQQLKTIAVTGCLPGEGKTTTTLDLALADVRAGRRVVVIDADLRRPKVAEYLGLESQVGITSVLAGRASHREVTQRHSSLGYDVITSGPLPPNPTELLGSQRMSNVLQALQKEYDVVYIDSPPALFVPDASAVGAHCDGTILVCRYKVPRTDDLTRTVDQLKTSGGRVIGLVFNAWPVGRSDAVGGYKAGYYAAATNNSPVNSELDAATDVQVLRTKDSSSESGVRPTPRRR